ncbi:hypothetical protein [Streptomyces sp. Root369]|nr:hypothetical protein [Streptomyces sp. Root369]
MIYMVQLAGLGALYWALRGKPSGLAALGCLVALLVSLLFWDAW